MCTEELSFNIMLQVPTYTILLNFKTLHYTTTVQEAAATV